jgi:hypothetical protein
LSSSLQPCSSSSREQATKRDESLRRPRSSLAGIDATPGEACATCGLSDLSIREHKHFTALCPSPQQAAALCPPYCTVPAAAAAIPPPSAYHSHVLRPHSARKPLRRSSWRSGINCRRSSRAQRGANSVQRRSQPCRHRARAAFTSLDFITPCFATRLTPHGLIRACVYHTAPSARSQRLRSTVRPPDSTPPPCAHPPVVLARAPLKPASRAQTLQRPACACPRAYRKLALAATAAGRVQRHWRVNRRHKGPQKTATRWLLCDFDNPVKARRDGMLVVSSATIYTCNGFWYNQPSSTERFRYVLLPARCKRRSHQLVLSIASIHLATCANTYLQPRLSLRTCFHSLVRVVPNEPGRQTSTAAQSVQEDTVVRIIFRLGRR